MKRTGERRRWGSATSVEDQILDLLHDYPYEYTKDLLSEGDRVLEVGFGWGGGAPVLQQVPGIRYEGIEVSPEAVEQAERNHGADEVRFRRYDGRRIPFDDASFDAVLSSHVLEHVEDPDGYLSEIKRVTRPGGTVVIVTPNGLHRVGPGERPWNRFHIKEYDGPAFEELFRRHFTDLELLGLDAEDELRAVELRRVARARKLARWDPLGLRYVIPESLMFRVRKILDAAARRASKTPPGLTPSMEQVHMTTKDWEVAIYLVAVARVDTDVAG